LTPLIRLHKQKKSSPKAALSIQTKLFNLE
jgi:hypothetical protein